MTEQRGDPAAAAIAHDADAARGHDNSTDGHENPTHEEEPLGPIDTTAWAAGIVGVVLGLVVALCFVLATTGIG